ncbi:Hypothetical predicted protein, partial [Paramuricea clavata]
TNPTLKSRAHTVGKGSQGIHPSSLTWTENTRNNAHNITHLLDEGNDDPDHGIIDVPIEDEDQADEDDIDQDTDIEKITKFIALFVLKAKEVNLVSQQAIDSMMDNTKTLVNHCLHMLGGKVKLCLAQNGLSWAEIDGLKEVFHNQLSIYETALGPVANKYLQVKYLMEKLKLKN